LTCCSVNRRGLPKQSTACPGSSQAGVRALADEIPFKLGECSEDVEHQLPSTGGGVDLLLQGPEANASLLQLPNRLDEMRQGAAEPV
jgi:hypothetical protein